MEWSLERRVSVHVHVYHMNTSVAGKSPDSFSRAALVQSTLGTLYNVYVHVHVAIYRALKWVRHDVIFGRFIFYG